MKTFNAIVGPNNKQDNVVGDVREMTLTQKRFDQFMLFLTYLCEKRQRFKNNKEQPHSQILENEATRPFQ